MKNSIQHFLVALFVLIIAVSVYGFFYSTVASKSARVAELDKQIKTKEETVGRIAIARAALGEIAGNEKTMRSYFISESDVVGFIGELESIGKSLNTSVSVTSVANAPENVHESIALTLTLNGSFDSVMRTAGAIEYSAYDIRVNSLSLALGAKNEWRANMSLLVGSTAEPKQ